MMPTLADGDRLVVRHGARPRAGAVAVVVLPPTGVLAIKRLAFAEGDRWWVERDNPAEGVDSWSVGPVPASDVRAIAVCRVWPWWRGSGWRALRTRRR
jgi:phage repressor protein C with HTH and peptisase S24 domain